MRKLLIGILIAVLILSWLLHQVRLGDLVSAMARVDVGLLAAALAIKFAVMLLKARRWAFAIVADHRGDRPRRVFSACLIGYAGNVVLPARLGEIARIMVLTKHNNLQATHALASMGVTQLFDMLILTIYSLIVGGVWAAGAGFVDSEFLVLFAAAVLGIFTTILLVQWKSDWLRQTAGWFGQRAPSRFRARMAEFFRGFVAGLRAMKRPTTVAIMVGYTLLIWGLETAAMGIALRAFGIDVGVGLVALMVVALNLSFAVPLTPGNIGTHQVLSVMILSLSNIAEVDALSFSIGYQGAVHLMILTLGGTCFYREGLSLRKLYRETCKEPDETMKPVIVRSGYADGSVS